MHVRSTAALQMKLWHERPWPDRRGISNACMRTVKGRMKRNLSLEDLLDRRSCPYPASLSQGSPQIDGYTAPN